MALYRFYWLCLLEELLQIICFLFGGGLSLLCKPIKYREMNKMIEMFDMNRVKAAIANCPKDEIVIICGNWSIESPDYTDDEISEDADGSDWYEMEQEIGHAMYVSDYNDLCRDPHGVMTE